jgi:hypothetical protein
MKRITRIFALFALASITANAFPRCAADPNVFENVELIRQSGDSVRETSVKIEFGETSMFIISRSSGEILKEMPYAGIKSAEYSYSKNPRWKTGLGLGAAAFIFPPLLFIAIPVGFSKHRRHWVTVRTENDYAVLKVSKKIRKVFMPAFETHTSIKIQALGDDK